VIPGSERPADALGEQLRSDSPQVIVLDR